MKDHTTSVIISILFFLLVIASAVGGFYFFNSRRLEKISSDPASMAALDEQQTLSSLSSIYVFPDEKPKVISITDTRTLPEAIFFKQVLVGDKLVVFQTTGQIVIYRPSVKKIVGVMHVSTESTTPSPSM